MIKYAACNAYLLKVTEKIGPEGRLKLEERNSGEDLSLIDYDREGEDKVLAAVLFRFSTIDATYEGCLALMSGGWMMQGRKNLVQDLMADRGRFDQPLREFEYAQMTFEAVMDQGAYFEFKRHRMMTQTVQPLTALLGYAVPKGIREAGCGCAISGRPWKRPLISIARVVELKIRMWRAICGAEWIQSPGAVLA